MRVALADALDLYARLLGADEAARLADAREALDEALVRVATVRRAAGASGDGDVSLATAVRAEAAARAHQARAEREAVRSELLAALALDPAAATEVTGALAPPGEIAALDDLLARADRRSDVLAGAAAVRLARADAEVQRRAGAPVPRLLLQGLRENEVFVQGGVEVPLPVYQRNQTARAVSAAVAASREAQREALRARARAQVVAAWRRSDGAARAYAALAGAASDMDDAERLAMRAYELGRSELAAVLAVRRAATDARSARLEALLAWVRARGALDAAAGVEP